MKDTQAGAAE